MSAHSLRPVSAPVSVTVDTPGQRNPALDILRACAICLVFMYHYMVFVSHQPTFGWLSEVGWVGVDLFFVLSGYLIGNQLCREVQGGQLDLRRFWLRRALRTLPVFWLVLAAYFCFMPVLGGKTPPPLWRFLTFTQNIQLQPGTAFSHAWSLCIEEQFYFVLPLVFVAGLVLYRRAALNSMRAVWLLLGLLILAAIGWRNWLWQQYGTESTGQIAAYYPNLYYATLGRFDELLPGLALALLKNFHPQTWQRLMARGRLLAAAGLAASLLMLYGALRYYYIDDYGYGFFMSVFGYTLLAWAFALLVAAALSPLAQRWRVPGAHYLALWSYSIYLTHKPLCNLLLNWCKQQGIGETGLLLLSLSGSIVLGALCYYAVEKPFLWLRDRYWPPPARAIPTPLLAQAA